MPPPVKPLLQGDYWSPDRRFCWSPAILPSPKRATTPSLQRQTEGLPVICRWCGMPWWPPMDVLEGWCSDACSTAEQSYLADRSERERLLDMLLEQDVENQRLMGLLGRSSVA